MPISRTICTYGPLISAAHRVARNILGVRFQDLVRHAPDKSAKAGSLQWEIFTRSIPVSVNWC